MPTTQRLLLAACAALLVAAPRVEAQSQASFGGQPDDRATSAALQEIVVTASREATLRRETPASISTIGGDTIETVRPIHPTEMLGRVPGVSVQQTNGEGHITGIRQPIDTSAVYLYLEDGVPVRPSGFFNHNALYELNLIHASNVEVIRGPGTALHGSDAIGGVVNALTRPPPQQAQAHVTLDTGAWGWLRGYGSAGDGGNDAGVRLDFNLIRSDGWREAFDYERQSLSLRADKTMSTGTDVRGTVAATRIDQQTGANSRLPLADYHEAPTRNYAPIAYRKVESVRAVLDVEHHHGAVMLNVTPFVRWSEMDLLPSWMLSYDPVRYTSGYHSTGLLLRARRDFDPLRARVIAGLDLDLSPGFREEDRIRVIRDGRTFTGYTLEERLYDYEVQFRQASPYVQVEASPSERLRLTGGLRFDALGFRYRNRLEDGQFVSGTPFGPRTFTRPADASLRYTQLSPTLGATYALGAYVHAFASYKESFRVPQEGQLFRQGANARSLDLEPVQATAYEAGLRGGAHGGPAWEWVAYRIDKRNDILTLNTGAAPTLTNNGHTRHTGTEVSLRWSPSRQWRIGIAGAYAEHVFRRWSTSDDRRYDGRRIASAPRTVASATLEYTPLWLTALRVELEGVHLGAYWLDDDNTEEYGGHELLHVRADYALSAGLELFVRVHNLLDTRWATSGAVSAGAPELVPGSPRAFYAGFGWRSF